MIKLIFSIQRETFSIEINGREIYYTDRKLLKKTRLIPVDENLAMKIKLSRNKLPAYLLDIFSLTEEEKIEYDNAKTEEELAELCIRDCKKNNAILQGRADGRDT